MHLTHSSRICVERIYKMKIAGILFISVFFFYACSGLPENLSIKEGFKISDAQVILDALEAQPSGKGLVSELYFDVTNDPETYDSTDWYLLPDNTQLGLYSTENKTAGNYQPLLGKQKEYFINQILLGEINQGYKGKLKWDMQIKVFFKELNLRNHLKEQENSFYDVGKIEVGDLFYQAVENLKNTCAIESPKKHDYIEMPNHIFRWVQLDNNMSIEILGESKTASGEIRIVQIRICNSTALFKQDCESWYHVQSIHYSNYGVRLWGIDVEYSYFNIYKGLKLKDALTTLKLAKIRESKLSSEEIQNFRQKIQAPKNQVKKSSELSFRKFRFKQNIDLIIAYQQILDGSYETITNIILDATVPELTDQETKTIELECEFLDLVNPLRTDWFGKFIK